jgi:hypothetical protein
MYNFKKYGALYIATLRQPATFGGIVMYAVCSGKIISKYGLMLLLHFGSLRNIDA